jgi:hypothetical protein
MKFDLLFSVIVFLFHEDEDIYTTYILQIYFLEIKSPELTGPVNTSAVGMVAAVFFR